MENLYHNSNRTRYPFSNPLANALVILVGILAIGASVVLGFIAFVVLGSLILVLAAIVSIRLWWLRYRLKRRGGGAEPYRKGSVQVEVIEGEYRVVSTSQPSDRDPEA